MVVLQETQDSARAAFAQLALVSALFLAARCPRSRHSVIRLESTCSQARPLWGRHQEAVWNVTEVAEQLI